jgi:hypothetical protein
MGALQHDGMQIADHKWCSDAGGSGDCASNTAAAAALQQLPLATAHRGSGMKG